MKPAFRKGRSTDGVATLSPSRFLVGELDVTSWATGPTPLSRVAWVSADAAEWMTHLEHLHVEAGEIVVDIEDVRVFR